VANRAPEENANVLKTSSGAARTRPIKILFNVCADAESYNAQSLNAREIALRLDPSRFESSLFFETSADASLSRTGIRLVKLPARRRTFRILREMLGPHDFIVYLDMSPASYLYLHLPRMLRRSAKTVVCVEGTRGNLEGVSPTVRKHGEYVLRHANVRTAISEFVAQDMYEAFGVRPDMTIPVGVDTGLFSPPAARDRKVPTVLFVGHLIARKGAQMVFEAAQRFPQARFRLIGGARDEFGRNLLRQYADAKPSNVSVESPVPQVELARHMRESDIFLLPSRIEGMPKVTLEAAATGLPCIVFNDYQTPSVIDGVTGFQVATFGEMLDRLQRLTEDAELRSKMGAAATAHAQQYDWDRVAKQWAAALQRLADSRA